MCFSPVYIYQKDHLQRFVSFPCGKCQECRRKRANDFVLRSVIESRKWTQNCIVSLTYSDTDGELCRRDFQLFMKRLRKKYKGRTIRYIGCGEYGSKKQRPHFHCVLFNYCPDDLVYFFTRDGRVYYKSEELSRLWSNGFVLVDKDFSVKALKYSILYFNKNPFDDFYGKVKPFFMCSTRPGIGLTDINESMINNDGVMLDGYKYSLPRYYLKKLVERGFDIETIVDTRKERYLRLQRNKVYIPTEVDNFNVYKNFYGNSSLFSLLNVYTGELKKIENILPKRY